MVKGEGAPAAVEFSIGENDCVNDRCAGKGNGDFVIINSYTLAICGRNCVVDKCFECIEFDTVITEEAQPKCLPS